MLDMWYYYFALYFIAAGFTLMSMLMDSDFHGPDSPALCAFVYTVIALFWPVLLVMAGISRIRDCLWGVKRTSRALEDEGPTRFGTQWIPKRLGRQQQQQGDEEAGVESSEMSATTHDHNPGPSASPMPETPPPAYDASKPGELRSDGA